MKNLIICNVKDKIKSIKKQLIEDTLKTRHLQNIDHYSFEVNTSQKNYVYNILIDECKKRLNSFTLKDTNFKLWGYYTDKSYHLGSRWHNHLDSSTINAVLYVKPVKGYGIEFIKSIGRIHFPVVLDPKPYDLLIFPNYVDHRPLIPKNKIRISYNLELRCKEDVNDIFKDYI